MWHLAPGKFHHRLAQYRGQIQAPYIARLCTSRTRGYSPGRRCTGAGRTYSMSPPSRSCTARGRRKGCQCRMGANSPVDYWGNCEERPPSRTHHHRRHRNCLPICSFHSSLHESPCLVHSKFHTCSLGWSCTCWMCSAAHRGPLCTDMSLSCSAIRALRTNHHNVKRCQASNNRRSHLDIRTGVVDCILERDRRTICTSLSSLADPSACSTLHASSCPSTCTLDIDSSLQTNRGGNRSLRFPSFFPHDKCRAPRRELHRHMPCNNCPLHTQMSAQRSWWSMEYTPRNHFYPLCTLLRPRSPRRRSTLSPGTCSRHIQCPYTRT